MAKKTEPTEGLALADAAAFVAEVQKEHQDKAQYTGELVVEGAHICSITVLADSDEEAKSLINQAKPEMLSPFPGWKIHKSSSTEI